MSMLRLLGIPSFLCLLAGCGPGASAGSGPAAGEGGSSAAGGATASGGAGTGGAAPDAALPPSGCRVDFTFTTVDNAGRYSPHNVSAVWVSDPSGAFVRTLAENGFRRQSHLVAWVTASGGNVVDAVTGATDRAPRTHDVTWDCTGLDGALLPPGTYTMNAEFTTSNTGGFFGGPAPLLQIPFALGSGPQDLSPPDEPLFVGIHLVVE